MDEFVEQLIEKHNFVVRVVLTDENSLTVNYAGKQNTSYLILVEDIEDGIQPPVCIIITTNEEQQEIVYIPLYLVRLYILCHIYAECRGMNLPYNIIQYFKGVSPDTYEKTMLHKLLSFELSDAERDSEEKLNQATCAVWQDFGKVNSFDMQMRANGLFASFNILKGLII